MEPLTISLTRNNFKYPIKSSTFYFKIIQSSFNLQTVSAATEIIAAAVTVTTETMEATTTTVTTEVTVPTDAIKAIVTTSYNRDTNSNVCFSRTFIKSNSIYNLDSIYIKFCNCAM